MRIACCSEPPPNDHGVIGWQNNCPARSENSDSSESTSNLGKSSSGKDTIGTRIEKSITSGNIGSIPVFSTTVKSNNKNVMSKTVRAKFKVDEVTDYGYGAKRVKLSAVYSHDRNNEDNQFSQATPSGSIEMMVTNPDSLEFLQPGKPYYVDFSEAEN